jgi:hypothetical protein
MKKQILLPITAIALSCGFVSCGEEEADGDATKIEKDGPDGDTTLTVDDQRDLDAHIPNKLPTPNMFFEVMSSIGGEANMDLVNPVGNKDNYVTKNQQALNFGVYFADMAYMLNYNNTIEVAKYFETLKEMADKLDAGVIFSEEVLNKIQAQGDNKDSLASISEGAYIDTYAYLEDNEMGDVLAYMVTGGWIEGMHITANMIGEFKEDSELIEEFAAQHIMLESIYENVLIYSEQNADLLILEAELSELQALFDAGFVESDEAASVEKEESGKLVFSETSDIKLDAELFGTIVEKIESIREKIVKNELN